ncbi:hypothetical protein [Williamsia sp.]|uniref:hypothetical protein n=1 Tax=Williamsia sp. TaxID=1872085 RepID=UPI002F93AC19
MSTNDMYAHEDALIEAGPNLAAVHLIANLRGVSFQQAMIDQVREWATALDESIGRHSKEAANCIGRAEHSATSPQQRRAWHFEAADHLAKIEHLSERRIVAVTMLAGVQDNPIDTRPHATS